MSFRKYTTSEQAILTTLLYSDIFSFPLTKDELWKFLISKKEISQGEFERSLGSLKKSIVFKNGYYCLAGKEKNIEMRIKNLAEVEKKMSLARVAAEKLSRIPSVLFIGISGGLAVGNASRDDDIDLVIITKKNTLFTSRLFVLFVLQSLGVRRARNQKKTADTICVNLLFDETALGWFGNHNDIYTAREIAQLLPLFERKGMYKKFITANFWIQDFLPNIILPSLRRSLMPEWVQGSSKYLDSRFLRKGASFFEASRGNDKVRSGNDKKVDQNDGFETRLTSILFLNPFFETLSRSLQIGIMKGHKTKEIVTKHVLAFHPEDYRVKTLRQLRLKMRQLGLLTNI